MPKTPETLIISAEDAYQGEVPEGYVITDRVPDRAAYYAEPDCKVGDMRTRLRRISAEAELALKLLREL